MAENPGDATRLFILDGKMTTTCTFTDVVQGEWYAEAVNALCSAGILVGYVEDDVRVFVRGEDKPDGKAIMVEMLKVLLLGADYANMAEGSIGSNPWYQFYLDKAAAMGLNLHGLQPTDNVIRAQALEWLAKIFYNYAGSDYVTFLKNKGITSGENTDFNVTRYEMAVLGYRAILDTGKDKNIPFGLWGKPAPKTPSSSGLGSDIVAKAKENLGEKYPYTDGVYTYCARFVRMMFDKPAIWADADAMCDSYAKQGVLKNAQNPPAGAAVCYEPNASNGNYGHVAIAAGDGTEIGATSLRNGVTQRNIVYGSAYRGWVSADDFNNHYPQ